MSDTRSSNTVHKEDGGLVYSSIRNDGTMIHWCEKCERIWVSVETPETKGLEEKGVKGLSRIEIDELRASLKKFSTE